jgi:hypothetical protein
MDGHYLHSGYRPGDEHSKISKHCIKGDKTTITQWLRKRMLTGTDVGVMV